MDTRTQHVLELKAVLVRDGATCFECGDPLPPGDAILKVRPFRDEKLSFVSGRTRAFCLRCGPYVEDETEGT